MHNNYVLEKAVEQEKNPHEHVLAEVSVYCLEIKKELPTVHVFKE